MDQTEGLIYFVDDVRDSALLVSYFRALCYLQPRSHRLENCVDGEQKWVVPFESFGRIIPELR